MAAGNLGLGHYGNTDSRISFLGFRQPVICSLQTALLHISGNLHLSFSLSLGGQRKSLLKKDQILLVRVYHTLWTVLRVGHGTWASLQGWLLGSPALLSNTNSVTIAA